MQGLPFRVAVFLAQLNKSNNCYSEGTDMVHSKNSIKSLRIFSIRLVISYIHPIPFCIQTWTYPLPRICMNTVIWIHPFCQAIHSVITNIYLLDHSWSFCMDQNNIFFLKMKGRWISVYSSEDESYNRQWGPCKA